jgi:hypothetical protein
MLEDPGKDGKFNNTLSFKGTDLKDLTFVYVYEDELNINSIFTVRYKICETGAYGMIKYQI